MKNGINSNDIKNFDFYFNIGELATKNAKLLVLIPCYNEFDRLPFEAFNSFITAEESTLFCFINDASTDQTMEKLLDLQKSQEEKIMIINLYKNIGKAEAIRTGVNHVYSNFSFDYLAFLDADLSTPLSEVKRAHQLMCDAQMSVVFGSRIAIYGNNIKRDILRHYFGRIFATFSSILLGLIIYDTQCGMKIFKGSLSKRLFLDKFVSRWFFDIEIFFRLKELYTKDDLSLIMREIPLHEWIEKGESKIRFLDIIKTPLILIKIAYKYRKKNVSAREHFILEKTI